MEILLELVVIEVLMCDVHNYSLWKCLYALPDKSFLNVKYIMENHIRVE